MTEHGLLEFLATRKASTLPSILDELVQTLYLRGDQQKDQMEDDVTILAARFLPQVAVSDDCCNIRQ